MNYTLVEVEKRGPFSPAGVEVAKRLPARVPAQKPPQRGPRPSAGSAALHFPRPSGQSGVSLRHRHMHPSLSARLSIKSMHNQRKHTKERPQQQNAYEYAHMQ